MLRDTFIVMGSVDSGRAAGAFHMYDIKDPRAPKLLASSMGNDTANLRELHAMPVAMINGKDILVFPTTTGIVFFDFTNPLTPKKIGALALSGVSGGDYDNAAWKLSWAYPYVYVGGTGNGLYVVDATDPANPTLASKVPTGSLGNFRIGPTFAAGNYVVVTGMDQPTTKVSVLDASNPKAPTLLTSTTIQASLYDALVVGDRIYGPGTNGDYAFLKWTPTAITMMAMGKSGSDRGGYCTYQSGFAVCGQSSEGYKKWDVQNETKPTMVGRGSGPSGGDFDFATIVGNLVYLGNDHGSGAVLIPHQMGPDNTPPTVMQIYPSEGETKQAVTSRVTVFLSEDYDIASVSPTSMIVRKTGGAAIEGTFSKSSFNALSFGPKAPLEANSTYEIVIPAGGLKDLVGNPIATAAMARFSTGATVTPGVGGASGGASGGSGGAGGGSGTGGVNGATGGSSASGGSSSTGGTAGDRGGPVATGGAAVLGTGGAIASTGGSVAPVGTGGKPSNTGGAGATGETGGGSAGCGCDVSSPGTGTSGALSLFMFAMLLGLRKKRSTRAAASRR
jgi:MYXO-CTERM domain-containing protein